MKTFFLSMTIGLLQYLIGFLRGYKQGQKEIKGEK